MNPSREAGDARAVRCGWCRRPPSDYPTCDTSPCGLLAAEMDIDCAVMAEHDDAPEDPKRGEPDA